MRVLVSISLSMLLAGCASNGQRIDQLATQAHLRREVIEVGNFKTIAYERRSSASDRPFLVFLEGDGVPWLRGVTPNTDPTTRDPLALKLLIQSKTAGSYVSRPCYQEVRSSGCTPDLWTDGRYSQQVVDIMVGAVEELIARNRAKQVVLVGFSGGGTLAVLAAERIPSVTAVITLAANLDTDAWTAYHDYLALGTSLNPARSEHVHSFKEIHLIGRLDPVVPLETRGAYFTRYPAAKQLVFDNYTHACCWLEDWATIGKRVDAALDMALLAP